MKQSTRNVIENLIKRYGALSVCKDDILETVQVLITSYRAGGKLLVCGNGGSAADAQHIVGELMKGFVLPRKLPEEKQRKIKEVFPEGADYLIDNLQGALPAISLQGEIALTSAYINDKAPDLAFAQQVMGLGRQGDVFLGISTSGNSQNVLYACQIAKVQGLKVIGLTGETGGKMKDLCDVAIRVPNKETFMIQELHLPIYHALCLALENEFFGGEQ